MDNLRFFDDNMKDKSLVDAINTGIQYYSTKDCTSHAFAGFVTSFENFKRDPWLRKRKYADDFMILIGGGFLTDYYYILPYYQEIGPKQILQRFVTDQHRSILLNLQAVSRVEDREHIVVVGQTPNDPSLGGIDNDLWLTGTFDILQRITKRPILFKPPHSKHGIPLPSLPSYVRVERSRKVCFSLAHLFVTYNSQASIEALLNGIPVFAEDSNSLMYDVCEKTLLQIECPFYPLLPILQRQFNKVAYTQWTLDEIAMGIPFSYFIGGDSV